LIASSTGVVWEAMAEKGLAALARPNAARRSITFRQGEYVLEF
jgi:hypothetical protein